MTSIINYQGKFCYQYGDSSPQPSPRLFTSVSCFVPSDVEGWNNAHVAYIHLVKIVNTG